MRKSLFPLLSLTACLLLAACAIPVGGATPVPQPTETPVPTIVVPTDTPIPAPTEVMATIPSDIFDRLNPTDKPLADWNGLPVMPGALAGGGGDTSYYYTIETAVEKVQAFYDKAMAGKGYSPMAVGNGGSGEMVLFYQKQDEILSISLFTKGSLVLVMFVQ